MGMRFLKVVDQEYLKNVKTLTLLRLEKTESNVLHLQKGNKTTKVNPSEQQFQSFEATSRQIILSIILKAKTITKKI